MDIIDFLNTVYTENKLLVYLLISILLGFLMRVYFTHSGTWEYSRETASKKVTSTILLMIVLALCIDTKMINIPINSRINIETITILIYLIIAIFNSLNNDNAESKSILTLFKFILIFTLSISSEIFTIVISILFAAGTIWFYIKTSNKEDTDKITFSEIILLCIENLLLSLAILIFIISKNPYSIILKVTFEETVLYSINYIFLFAVKDKINSH